MCILISNINVRNNNIRKCGPFAKSVNIIDCETFAIYGSEENIKQFAPFQKLCFVKQRGYTPPCQLQVEQSEGLLSTTNGLMASAQK